MTAHRRTFDLGEWRIPHGYTVMVALAILMPIVGLIIGLTQLRRGGGGIVLAAILAFVGIRSVKKVRAPQRTMEQAQ